MKKQTKILGGVLAAQLALALILTFTGSDRGAFKAKEPLLAFDSAKVDEIDIDETRGNSARLVKKNGSWVVPALADFPADQARVSGLLTNLASLKKGWPVATTGDAAKRFKVTDESHERRVILKSGGKQLGEFLFGTSPAFRQVHARVSGDAKVYSVAFATYDAGARGEDWMKRDYLAVPEDKIASISINDVKIERKDGKFQLQGLADGEKAKETDVWKLAGALAHPAYDVVQGKGKDALAKLDNPDITASVKLADGSTITYKYRKEAAGGAYLFGSSAHDFLFRVGEASIEPIVKAKHENLVQTPKKEAAGAQADTKPQAPQSNSSGG